MRFSFVAIAASLIAAVSAQQAYPTAPIATTVWNAGAPVSVEWKVNATASKLALAVDLFKGDPAHQTQVAKLGAGAPGATKLAVTLPAKLDSDWYSIRIGDAYSHYFQIKGTGPLPTGPAPAAGSGATGGVPSATGGASATGVKTTASAPSATPLTGAGNALSVGPLAMAVAAIVAVAFTF